MIYTLKLDSSVPFLIGNSGRNGTSEKFTGQTVFELRYGSLVQFLKLLLDILDLLQATLLTHVRKLAPIDLSDKL